MKKILCAVAALLLFSFVICAIAEDIDLTAMTREELHDLHERINDELKKNHMLTSSEESKLKDAAKRYVEDFFAEQGKSVSWAWFDYDYVRDWGYATMSSHFDAEGEDKKSTRYNVVVGAYLTDEEWNVIYLELNGEPVYDLRDQIPDPRLNPAASDLPESEATPEPAPVEEATPEPTSEPTPEPTEEPLPEANEDPVGFLVCMGIPEEIASDREYVEMRRGDKGDSVKALQEDLILIGILKGTADGDYGQKTEDAVKAYQGRILVEETGIADLETQAWLRFDVYCSGGYDEPKAEEEPAEEPNNALPTELSFGKLLSVTETGTDDIVVIKAKIEPSYSNKATVDQNYYNIETLAKKYGFSRYNTVDYWAVADMSDGSEQKVVAFTVSKDVVQLLADGKIPANGLGDYVNDLWIHPSLQ